MFITMVSFLDIIFNLFWNKRRFVEMMTIYWIGFIVLFLLNLILGDDDLLFTGILACIFWPVVVPILIVVTLINLNK